MTAASPVKFRFDLDLGHREERNSVLTESALAMLVTNARAEGYSDGLVEGQRAGVVKAAERLAHAAELLADHTAALKAAEATGLPVTTVGLDRDGQIEVDEIAAAMQRADILGHRLLVAATETTLDVDINFFAKILTKAVAQ